VPKEEKGKFSVLEAYAKRYPVVEVNSTFYKLPRTSTCEKWWKSATSMNSAFEFAVKAHQDITHTYGFELKKEAIELMERILEICRSLHAQILLFQTPKSFQPTDENLKRAKEFFATFCEKRITMVWEMRGEAWKGESVIPEVEKILREYNVIHCTDILVDEPIWTGSLAYTRLHGLGKRMYYYKYTNDDLISLKERIEEIFGNYNTIYVLFNNIDMYDDAMRFISLLKGEKLPPERWGVDALLERLSDVTFPISKRELLNNYGKRKFFKSPSEYVTVSTYLNKIPDRSYNSLQELKEALEEVI